MRNAYASLREEYLATHTYEDVAAIALARDLMEGWPTEYKQGYSRANAILAAQEVFPEADEIDWDKEIPDAE